MIEPMSDRMRLISKIETVGLNTYRKRNEGYTVVIHGLKTKDIKNGRVNHGSNWTDVESGTYLRRIRNS